MKNTLAFILAFVLAIPFCFGQIDSKDANSDEAYTKTINTRAQKIVATLNIKDSAKASSVQSIIAAQYRNLSSIHSDRDAQIKVIKEKNDLKENSEVAIKKVEELSMQKISKLHEDFIAALSSHLTKDQVIQVKDGLTYNVVNITYAGYLDMLQNLTTAQKAQIMTWLVEAREYAMDAETSEKKHGWFGKYKGRINNYLSAAGYDLKKEGEAWQQRIKEKEAKKNTSKN